MNLDGIVNHQRKVKTIVGGSYVKGDFAKKIETGEIEETHELGDKRGVYLGGVR